MDAFELGVAVGLAPALVITVAAVWGIHRKTRLISRLVDTIIDCRNDCLAYRRDCRNEAEWTQKYGIGVRKILGEFLAERKAQREAKEK